MPNRDIEPAGTSRVTSRVPAELADSERAVDVAGRGPDGTLAGALPVGPFDGELMRQVEAGELPVPPEVNRMVAAANVPPEAQMHARRVGAAVAQLYITTARQAAQAAEGNPGLPPPEPPAGQVAMRYHQPGADLRTLGNRRVWFCELCGAELRPVPGDPDGPAWFTRDGQVSCPGPRTDRDSYGDAFHRELQVPRQVRFVAHPAGDSVVMMQAGRPAGRFPWAVAVEMVTELGGLVAARMAAEEQQERLALETMAAEDSADAEPADGWQYP